MNTYPNYDKTLALGKAFKELGGTPITIPPRDCQDVPIFLKKLREASELTKKSKIHFG